MIKFCCLSHSAEGLREDRVGLSYTVVSVRDKGLSVSDSDKGLREACQSI